MMDIKPINDVNHIFRQTKGGCKREVHRRTGKKRSLNQPAY